jgi:hypothetical protein
MVAMLHTVSSIPRCPRRVNVTITFGEFLPLLDMHMFVDRYWRFSINPIYDYLLCINCRGFS